jgi:hypothetical protein
MIGNRLGALIRLFGGALRDERGATAVYMGAAIAVLVGIGGLAIDLGRYMTVNTQLQKFADAAALAGAAELDGKTGSIARATAAAQGAFATNLQSFASGGQGISIPADGIRFLSALDPNGENRDNDTVTTVDAEAMFIEVTSEMRAVPSYLISVLGGPAAPTTAARAIAGYTQAVCKVPPLFICNPDEDPSNPGGTFNTANWIGKQILMKANADAGNTQVGSGNNAAWGPGDFGLLQPPDANSSNKAISEQLGGSSPLGCYSATVDLAPGEKSVSQGLNVRFDMYDQSFNNQAYKSNPEYRPAKTVIKGLKKKGGGYEHETGWQGLPRDNCFPADATIEFNGSGTCDRFGDGQWDFQDYWDTNHIDKATGLPFTPPNGWSDANRPSRYQLYRWEVEQNPSAVPRAPTPVTNPNPITTGEEGKPQNYKNGSYGATELDSCAAIPNPSDPSCDTAPEVLANFDRRVLIMAVVNCIENEAIIKGAQKGVPVEGWAMFFLTEPMKDDTGNSNKEVWGEVVGELDPGNVLYKEIVKDVVQLYR